MNSTSNSGTAITGALRHALETSDAAALIGLYADNAEVIVLDSRHQPSNPLVLSGKEAIAGYWQDVCGRAMTHTVERIALDGHTLAYSEACRYPDGTQVQCIAFLDLADGRIVKQKGVQTWDEQV